MPSNSPSTLTAQLAQIAAQAPHSTAICSDAITLTYSDLTALTQGIAWRIGERVATGTRIALLFNQGALYIASLLGTLHAGCAFVPLDIRRSAEWNQTIAAAAGCTIVLCSPTYRDLADKVAPTSPITISSDIYAYVGSMDEPATTDPAGLACIYYTSGSTGKPKGVCDSQRNLIHNAMRYTNSLRIDARDRLSLIQSPVFSGTQSTMFASLLAGATLLPFDLHGEGLPALGDWVQRQQPTMLHCVPAILQALSRTGVCYKSLRTIRLEGDVAQPTSINLLGTLTADHCVLVNGLGATECGLIRQHFYSHDDLPALNNQGLDSAIPDMEVMTVNTEGERLDPDATGEIAVRSRHLALGYLDDPTLTASKFRELEDGSRLYLTGDLGWLSEQGALHLVGRADQRIRLHGETIDVAEVESVLAAIDGIAQGVVALAAPANSKDAEQLTAYLVAETSPAIDHDRLFSELTRRLPSAHRPQRLVWLASLPLSLDGKIDRGALPAPTASRPDLDTPYRAPRDLHDKAIVAIWEEVLSVQGIGIDDEFVLLGGDSIKAIQTLQRVEQQTGQSIAIAEVFARPTIAMLADFLEQQERE